ncbi:MAG: class I SAM-dependent methyltransferase, partial [Acidobacteria bacterium]|nr:class I SAM-dependent methyltransferase [Acidobacteriota bacterium]
MLRFLRRTPVLEARAAYARWAPVYPARAHNALMRAEQRVTEALLGRIRAERVLDVGTGTGRYRPVLARWGARHIVGLDFSWEMLTAGRDTGAGVLVCGDAVALPIADAVFDLALASLMVGDIADLTQWVAEIHRVLRPGGHLVFSDFHESWTADGWR